MALWPFNKKKDNDDEGRDTPDTTPDTTSGDGYEPVPDAAADEAAAATPGAELAASVEHDAVGGDTGPFDGDSVDIESFDFSDYSTGVLNLGSMKIPLPKESQVQVEMGEKGPRMLHIVTRAGRITPVAFAAPTQGGQWEEASQEIRDGMLRDGLEDAEFVPGPWGREIAASRGENAMRVIGIDGPRWMLRLTLAAPVDKADDLADIARGLAARTFVYRGDDPMLAGTSLPVALPAPLVEQVQKAMKQREEQARLQKQGEQQQIRQHDEEALSDAAEALRKLGINPNPQTGQNPGTDAGQNPGTDQNPDHR